MPYCILDTEGAIKSIFLKPTPWTRIGVGERMVRYDPPSYDPELEDMIPQAPVPPGVQGVAFTRISKPAGTVRDVLWSRVRARRDAMLRDCDWVVLPDSPTAATQKAQWVQYRQALRDVTNQPEPANIIWPSAPV